MLREYGLHPHDLSRLTRRELHQIASEYRAIEKARQEVNH